MDSGGVRRGRLRPSPRTTFSQRFAELFAAAGNPTLRRVAAAAEARMRAARAAGQKSGASVQRISDWKSGRNVPARFEVFLPVLLTLVDEARKSNSPVPVALLDVQQWQRLWTASNEWDPNSDAADVVCPYLGLAAYRPEDTEVFFGRGRPTAELADLVRRTVAGDGGMVVLVGASGAGKSSLLQAGLVPALRDSADGWAVATLTPGADPMHALSAAVGVPLSAVGNGSGEPGSSDGATVGYEAETEPEPSGSAPSGVENHSGPASVEVDVATAAGVFDSGCTENGVASAPSVSAALSAWGAGRRRLLVVDQLEELFTLCRDERQRVEFLGALEHLAIRGDGEPAAVVLAVRADFYARCLDEPALEDALKHRSYLLGPMRLDELAEAIGRPAESAGYKLESGLEELVISELCGLGGERRSYDPGALPLVSHVMEAVWQRREGSRLTIEGYRAAGGVLGSVAATAENAWSELTDFQQALGKQVLLGLVAVGDDSRDTRRRVSRADLLRQTVVTAEAALDALARTRLITLDADTAYLTHEIVLDAWPRLRSWIDEDRVGYLERQRLQADATEWVERQRDSSLLYRGARLVTMREHARGTESGPVAAEFLRAGESARRRADRRAAAGGTALVLLTVVALILAGVAFVQRHDAARDRDAAVFNSVLAEADRLEVSDPSLSAQLALVAQGLRPHDPEVLARLINTANLPLATPLTWKNDMVTATAFRPDGRLLATGSFVVHLWDVSDRRAPHVVGGELPGGGVVNTLAFSPNGQILAAAAADNVLRLWDVRDPEHAVPLGDPLRIGNPTAVGFGPDGSTLAVSSPDGGITFWDITDPRQPRSIGTPIRAAGEFRGTTGVAFSADLHRVVVVGDRGVTQLWDIADPRQPAVPVGSIDSTAMSAALSPDGRVVALATTKAVEIWDYTGADVATHAAASLSDIGVAGGTGLAFRDDGRVLAYPSSGSGVALVDLTELSHPIPMGRQPAGPYGYPTAVTFAPDRHAMVVGGRDSAYLWSLPDPIAVARTSWPRGPLVAVGGRTLLVGDTDRDRYLEAWQMDDSLTARRLGRLDFDPMTGAPIQSVVSPDGRTLALSPYEKRLRLYDVSETSGIVPRADVPRDESYSSVVVFSPDSARLFVSETENGVALLRIWDVRGRTPTLLADRIPLPFRYLIDLAVAPDGRSLAMVGDDGAAELWSIADPAHPVRSASLQPSGSVLLIHLRFGPGGRTLTATADDQTLRVWDVTDRSAPVRIGDPLSNRPAWVSGLDYSADGRYVASIDSESVIRLWDFTDRTHPRVIKHPIATTRPIPLGGTIAFRPDGRHLLGTGADGLVRFWDLDPADAVTRVCATTRSIMTPQIWREHLPGLAYRPPCP
ncbi:NACHT and WD repeat domain-containing protein [Nocardia sp. BMG111209]|uniref:NACHT and WD repeat domain-containing protein n=1 Tax=Nocardia sp. BMG111209 TaxID=1160137 RepID=UPI00037E1997|nr:NACHT and WD repeat domain-containing protein [Nocardia sp. BMG111209]